MGRLDGNEQEVIYSLGDIKLFATSIIMKRECAGKGNLYLGETRQLEKGKGDKKWQK